jgi:hypothetical protein
MKKKLPVATPEEFEGMTLMRMRSENIKLLRFVDVTLKDTVTLVGGENDQGKTSFLDSYGWCLRGKLEIQMDPIRHGAQTGSITCDFGDGEKVKLSVTRTLKRVGDAEWTEDVDVEIPGHIPPSRIEDFLRKLTGEFAVDPMAFDRLKAPEKFEALQTLITDFDFKSYERNRKTFYDERTDVGRDQRREQSAADAMLIAVEPPCERVDEEALQQELTDAGQKNLDIERRRGNRDKAVETIAAARLVISGTERAIEAARLQAEAIRDQEVTRLEERIAEIQKQIESTRQICDQTVEREGARIRDEARAALASANELQAKLDAAGELSPPADTAAIGERLTEARASNKRLDAWETQRNSRKKYQDEADRLAKKYAELSEEIATLDAAKQSAIEAAELPVEGLGFAEGYITLPAGDGSGPVPWEQAGTAVRTDASLALAMAMQPKLKVILIRDASLIGKTIRERIRQRASERGYRVLMEVVEEGKGTHVVIENGMVKRAAEGEAA